MPSGPSLFLEATQLKTVRTGVAVLRTEPAVAEVQVVGIVTLRRSRRPTEPVVADTQQCSVSVIVPGVAEARGLCRSALEPGCVYPNKGPRRDANASAAGASPQGVLLAVRTRNFPRKTQPSSAERHPRQNTQRVRRGGAPIGRFIGLTGEKFVPKN